MSDAANTWIINKIRACMKVRGLEHNIVNLSRMFRAMDTDSSSTINFEEFRKGIKNIVDIDLTYHELSMLFELFDSNSDGEISYEELMEAILPPVNQVRLMFIDAVWLSLKPNTQGVIPASKIFNTVNVQFHPLCARGTLTKQQAFCDFLTTFESNQEDTGRIFKREFKNYCFLISAECVTDQEFGRVITRLFGLENAIQVYERVLKDYTVINSAGIESQHRNRSSPRRWTSIEKPVQGFQGAVHNLAQHNK